LFARVADGAAAGAAAACRAAACTRRARYPSWPPLSLPLSLSDVCAARVRRAAGRGAVAAAVAAAAAGAAGEDSESSRDAFPEAEMLRDDLVRTRGRGRGGGGADGRRQGVPDMARPAPAPRARTGASRCLPVCLSVCFSTRPADGAVQQQQQQQQRPQCDRHHPQYVPAYGVGVRSEYECVQLMDDDDDSDAMDVVPAGVRLSRFPPPSPLSSCVRLYSGTSARQSPSPPLAAASAQLPYVPCTLRCTGLTRVRPRAAVGEPQPQRRVRARPSCRTTTPRAGRWPWFARHRCAMREALADGGRQVDSDDEEDGTTGVAAMQFTRPQTQHSTQAPPPIAGRRKR
jgi:hypothetical protein